MNATSETAAAPAKSKKLPLVLMALALPAIIVCKVGVVFLVIGMIPTVFAATLPRDPKGYILTTVAAFNFAGVFPDLLGIATQGGSLGIVMGKLSDITVWASMYGAALLGWGIVWLSPSIALVILEAVYKGRKHHLEAMQKKLEEEWGPEIAGRKE